MRLTAELFLTLAVLLCATPATQVSPDPQSDEWWQRNDRCNRYEGVTDLTTGNPDLEVLSFTGSQEGFGKESVNLKVRFFNHAEGKLSIIAQEIETRSQYFMKVKQESWPTGRWNEFGPWPTGDIINKENVESNRLGVLISAGGNRLLPAFVYHSTLPATVSGYRMHLRSNKNFDVMRVSLYGNQDKGRPTPKPKALPGQVANMPFSINLDVRGYGEGPMRIVIERCLRKETDKKRCTDKLPDHEYLFYHRPAVR